MNWFRKAKSPTVPFNWNIESAEYKRLSLAMIDQDRKLAKIESNLEKLETSFSSFRSKMYSRIAEMSEEEEEPNKEKTLSMFKPVGM